MFSNSWWKWYILVGKSKVWFSIFKYAYSYVSTTLTLLTVKHKTSHTCNIKGEGNYKSKRNLIGASGKNEAVIQFWIQMVVFVSSSYMMWSIYYHSLFQKSLAILIVLTKIGRQT